MFLHYCLIVEKRVTKPWHKIQEENSIIYSFHRYALVPVGEFISKLQTSEIPEGIMKHAVFSAFS
jgi:hypothetical protein